MGIPYYFTYIIKNHNKIIDNLKNLKNINQLYIDSNSLIYDSINFDLFENKNQFEKNIIDNVIIKINEIIKSVKPLDFTYISFDGIPPFAKLNQQKNRRYKNQYQDLLFDKKKPWDSASITAGTNFMNNLNKEIKKNFTGSNYILSLSDIKGEGEHKIFQYIRNNNDSNKNILIYGMDADLIMLSLNHLKYCNNIFLFRETPDFINTINNSYNINEKYYMKIYDLSLEIYKIMIKNNSNEFINNNNICNYTNFYNKISDYIFMCFMLGNDFIPHFPALNIRINGLTILLEIYKETFSNNEFLTNIESVNINWKNFKKFIYNIAKNEEFYIKTNYDILNKKKYFKNNTLEEKLFKYTSTPQWEKNYEHFINPYEKHWEFRYYFCIFDKNIDDDDLFVPNMCNEYLKILLWTFNYYCNDCINWIYFYNYSYPPLLMDLYKNIPYFESEIVLENNNEEIEPIITLSYVLPKNSLDLLPNKIKKYLLTNFEKHYSYDHEIIYPFCKYIWEGHVKFTEIELNEFINNIKNII